MGFATHLFIVPPDQPVDDSFICGICHDVFDNATNLNACGHTFCRLCVIAVVESASSMNCCPICRKVFDIHQSHPNYTVNNLIGRMMIKCKRCIISATTAEEEENDGNNGRNAAAAAAAAAEEEKMPPAKKPRMDEGGDDDNDAVVTANQTKEDETPVAASTAAAAASSIVPQQPQQQDQVNLGCTWTGKVSDWYKHTKHDCSYEEITCPARGCTHRCTRKQLSQHMADSVERHLVLNMNSQIAELRREFSLRLEAFRTSIISGQASAIPPPSTIIITEAGCPEVNGTYRKVNIVHPTTTTATQQQPPSNILCQYVQEKKNEQNCNPSNSNTTGGPSSSTSNHHHHHHHDPSSSSSENIGSVSGNYCFSINLCTMRNGNCAWTIGIPFEEQPGTDRDLDFYRSQTMEKSLAIKIGAPPAVWKCDSYGRNPLPKMEYIV